MDAAGNTAVQPAALLVPGSNLGRSAFLYMGHQRMLHFLQRSNMDSALRIPVPRENSVEPLPQRFLKLGAIIAAWARDRDLPMDRILDVLDGVIIQYACFDEFRTELQKANGCCVRTKPDELQRMMKLKRLFSPVIFHWFSLSRQSRHHA
jgi:hypothetical protein